MDRGTRRWIEGRGDGSQHHAPVHHVWRGSKHSVVTSARLIASVVAKAVVPASRGTDGVDACPRPDVDGNEPRYAKVMRGSSCDCFLCRRR
eukprot:353081-Chlamydomonas_euryale.AAC.2